MATTQEPLKLAKLSWTDPQTGDVHEHVLTEGATATIGRSANNDICVPDRHVSRQHAVITYRDGIFMISDLESANGTFVNDQQIAEAFPLFSGDVVRLFMPTLTFESATEEDSDNAAKKGTLITSTFMSGKGQLVITSGPQEGQTIPLLLKEVTIGRATSTANWEIGLQDPSVSRPHARMEREDRDWVLYDLDSSNGTFVNDQQITGEQGYTLRDGDAITFGATMVLFLAR